MYKNRIQVDWLNKLYDDIYYSELEDSEHTLDIITNLISSKEVKFQEEEKSLVAVVIEVTEELASLLESEELLESYNFITKRIEEIQMGDFDNAFREEYFPDFYDLEKDEEMEIEIDMEELDDEDEIDEY
ncbi:hypothetical protein [Senegalia sp. (in: firmicutes)]|uniref:hypothetical protein n=2 Tax=Senegalia sp. (in: firmicutes) TaxID=1924098 RepID=UPI003F97C6FE